MDRQHRIILDMILQTKNLQKKANEIYTTLNKSMPKVDLRVDARSSRSLKTLNKDLNATAKSSTVATKGMLNLGQATALAAKRLLAYSAAAAPLYAVTRAIDSAAEAAVDFEYQLVRIAQVQRRTLSSMGGLNTEITKLSTTIGAVSSDLVQVSRLLAQSGLSARDTQIALNSLAKTSLTPSFNDIIRTTEGAIAIMSQFGTSADQLEGQLGSINAVAKRFAVESEDIITVIRKAGGVFSSTGGKLDELIALFTAVRSTTRESAETIGTGFRTIFARLERTRTINLLRRLGIETEGEKPYQKIQKIAAAIQQLQKESGGAAKIAKIREELGGLRQIAKVIPLLEQFPKAIRALDVARKGQTSLEEDVQTAQEATIIQLRKVKQEFLALGRAILGDRSIQTLIKSTLQLTTNLIKLVDALRPALPLLLALGGIRLAALTKGAVSGLSSRLKSNELTIGIKGTGFKGGGLVPAALTPGEVVFPPDEAQRIGYKTLSNLNKFAYGGVVPGKGNTDSYLTNLESGSFVLRKKSAEKLGLSGYAKGGRVGFAHGGWFSNLGLGNVGPRNVDELLAQAKAKRLRWESETAAAAEKTAQIESAYAERDAQLRRESLQKQKAALAQEARVRKAAIAQTPIVGGILPRQTPSTVIPLGGPNTQPRAKAPRIINLPGITTFPQAFAPGGNPNIPTGSGLTAKEQASLVRIEREARKRGANATLARARVEEQILKDRQRYANQSKNLQEQTLIAQRKLAARGKSVSFAKTQAFLATSNVQFREPGIPTARLIRPSNFRERAAERFRTFQSTKVGRQLTTFPTLGRGLGLGRGTGGLGKGLARSALPAALLLPSLLPQEPKTAGAAGISAGLQTGVGVGALVAGVNPLFGVVTGVVSGLGAMEKAVEDFNRNKALTAVNDASNKYAEALKKASLGTGEFADELNKATAELSKSLQTSFKLIDKQSKQLGLGETLQAGGSSILDFATTISDAIQAALPESIAGTGNGGGEFIGRQLLGPAFNTLLGGVFDEQRAKSVNEKLLAGLKEQRDSLAGAGEALKKEILAGRGNQLNANQFAQFGLQQANDAQLRKFVNLRSQYQGTGATESQVEAFQLQYFAKIAGESASEMLDLESAVRANKEANIQAARSVQSFASRLELASQQFRLAGQATSGQSANLSVLAGARGGFRASSAASSVLQNFRAANPAQYRAAAGAVGGAGVASTVGLQQEVAKILPSLIEDATRSGGGGSEAVLKAIEQQFGGRGGIDKILAVVQTGLGENFNKLIGNLGKGGAASISDQILESFSFMNKALGDIAQERMRVEQNFIDDLATLSNLQQQSVNAQKQIVGAERNIAQTRAQFAGRAGIGTGNISAGASQAFFARQQSLAVFGSDTRSGRARATSAGQLENIIRSERSKLLTAQQQKEALGPGASLQQLQQFDSVIQQATTRLRAAEAGLQGLADSTSLLSDAQQRLTDLQKAQEGTFSIADQLLTADPRRRRELQREISGGVTLLQGGNVSGRRFGAAYARAQELAPIFQQGNAADQAIAAGFAARQQQLRGAALGSVGLGGISTRINRGVVGAQNRVIDIQQQQKDAAEAAARLAAEATNQFVDKLIEKQKVLVDAIPKSIELTTPEPLQIKVSGDQMFNSLEPNIKQMIADAIEANNKARASDPTRSPTTKPKASPGIGTRLVSPRTSLF